ncbi:MAG: response regulator, partial [Proteobacteria bacterium]|nr:response regulator [Pseudomonadota bacterium]
GDAALQALKQDSNYDLLLTDIIMPGQTDGLALAKYVKQHYPETRVLCMSGYSEKIDSKIDTHMLIRKPFSSNELAARVRERLSNA